MESLSRPFHSRKLSNATTTFSGKNAYDGVFSGHPHNFTGPSPINVQDYREIFGNSQAASSIPVLDLSTLGLPLSSDTSSSHDNNLRSSKPDYAMIFGGFRDEDIAVSYEELFARDKARAPSSTTPTSRDSDELSHHTSDVLKQFNMSYNKISQKSKDGLDGTKHVTKLVATPGFTCFIDEPVPPPNMEAEKHKSSAVHIGVDSSKESFLEKQTLENAVRKRSKHHAGESFSEDKLFKAFDIDPKIHPFAVVDDKIDPKRSTAINSESCKTDTSESAPGGFSSSYFDKELDVNSNASASAAALKKAIENAQESIRIAKESVGRKKKGLHSFSSKTHKNNLKVEGTTEDANAGEEHKYEDDVKGVFGRVFPDIRKNYKYGATAVFLDFMEGEKLFVAKKVIDEIQGKISESSKGSSIQVESAKNRPLDSAGKDEYATLSSEAEKRTETADFVHEVQTDNMSVDDYEGKIKVTNPTTVTLEHHDVVKESESVERACLLHKHRENGTHEKNVRDSDDTVEVDESGESEENKDEARLSNAHKLITELNDLAVSQKVEDEKKISQESNQNDNDERLNEKQEVLEEEDVENAEKLRKKSNDEASNKRLEEASEWVESEYESKDDNTEIHKDEETSEMLCELENRKESAETLADNREESDMTRQDDYEIKQEDSQTGESLDESCDQEFDENSSVDDNVMEETFSIDHSHVANHIITDTQEIDDVTDASEGELKEKTSVDETTSDGVDEFKVNSDNLEDVGSADTCFQQNETQELNVQLLKKLAEPEKNGLAVFRAMRKAREHAFAEARERAECAAVEKATEEANKGNNNNDEEKIVPTEEEESNNELHHEEIPETGSSNEIKASQEPQVLNETEKNVDVNEIRRSENREKEEEIRETGPSNEAGKENRRRIDEVTAREREPEKTGLAVFREIRARAFAVARERAERAAVEKATEEANKEINSNDEEKIVPTEEEESNNELHHEEIPETGSSNEIKVSQEPQVLNETEKNVDVNEIRRSENREKEEEIRETGPSNEAGKENRRRIDEVIAREREPEKTGLAAFRAIRARAFAAAHERAERAAVEKATEEANKKNNSNYQEEIVPTEEEESNNELPHEEIPETGSANEIKASQEPQVLNKTEKPVDVNEIKRSENREKEDEIRGTWPRNVAGKENRRRIDEANLREREREKNRLAVDRAIREARERAFAEARERAERAAVEKATEEVRQRMMADAQEKAAIASVGTKSSSEPRYAESKLRAERAAVERATSEARQRALEKAMSQKSVFEATRENSSSSESHRSNGTNSESALRSKERLEKHNRIMERAAKALAEKEKRDLLAQKEQAERNRLAKNLDADIKRWSKGKEGNLRALLSTLQYILGPESGWQAVALTEIIAMSAVKKAYRKATLCVHPDKLQQRGASIQQKYICEKVFDLLKAAWNRFNSE